MASVRGLRFVAREGLLLAALVALYLLILPWAAWRHGPTGPLAAALAFTVSFVGASLALGVSQFYNSPLRCFEGLLYAIVLRTGIPLGFAVVMHLTAGLLWGGLVYYLLLAYLVALAVESFLSLPAQDKRFSSGRRELT